MTDVLFVSPMCLLDSRSGAAQSVRSWLELLAAAGWSCEALTLSVFDGPDEYPRERLLGSEAAARNHGKLLRIAVNGVRHSIFYTRSTVGPNITREERTRFMETATVLMGQAKPQVAVSYGSSDYTRRLQDLARRRCRHFVFYLANAEFRDQTLFAAGDLVVCPSGFLAGHYRKTLGIDPQVIRPVIQSDKFFDGKEKISSHPALRRAGCVTYVNPQPDKGLTLFWRLVHMARMERPEITFLAVEGRVSRDRLRRIGADLGAMSNVWWLPNQSDMRRIYQRTSMLLFPSFVAEAAGRVIAEAQLSGIPVLAANRGGIPEQLNGGGFLFDVPGRCIENYRIIPSEAEVRPWLETIGRLMDDEAAYVRAVTAAEAAAGPFLPERRREAVLRFFEPLLHAAPAARARP
jgi:glycosyltransferase involved in cell wall biosynthesis